MAALRAATFSLWISFAAAILGTRYSGLSHRRRIAFQHSRHAICKRCMEVTARGRRAPATAAQGPPFA